MSATTYFGDVVTTGNTNIVQNMTAFGNVICNGNVFINGDIGTLSSPFGPVYVKSINVATMNASTFQTVQIITGNVVASNAYQGGNLFTTQMDVAGVSNMFSLVSGPNLGIGMSIPLVAVTGTAYIDSTIAATQGFGGYVALSSDGLVMVSTNSPYVIVYQYNGSSWTGPVNTLMSTTTTNVSCPIAVSSDGTVVIVGDYSNGSRGYAAVFRTGSESVLTNPTADYSNFGWTVALSADGNTALVSAPNDADGDGWVGIYKYSGGAWGSATALVSTFGQYGAFGTTAGLSGDGLTVIVANGYNTTAVYRYSGGVWSYASQLPVSIASSISTQRGISISYDGNTIVAGFPFYSGSTGIVGVYKYSGGSWVETLITNSVEPYINFGASVSISTNGNILVVGAPAASYPNNKGWAGVYTYSGGSWGSPSQLIYTPSNNDNFGWTVAVSSTGSTVIVGSQAAYVGAFIKGPYTSYLNLSLGVQGNVYMSNVTTTNVSLYNLLNVSATMNTGTLVTPLSINPVYQLPKDSSTLTNPYGGTTNFGSNLSYSGDGSRFVTFPISGGSAYYSFAYKFTSNVFGGYWNMYEMTQITPIVGPTNGYASAFSYDGNTLIIGEPGAYGIGSATVYKPGGVGGFWAGTPLQPGSILGSSLVAFGAAVAISPEGDVAVVGAPRTNFNTGIAWAYKYSNGVWSDPITIPFNGFVNQYFGYSVAVCSSTTGGMASGGTPGTNTILVGVPGAAIVYLYTFFNNIVYPNTFFSFGLSASDWLGWSLSISYDGFLAIAGAPYYSGGVGTVITFGQGGNQTLTSPAGAGGNFGASVGLAPNGLTAVVGAPNASSGVGYAAKYTLSAPTYTWSSATELVAPVSTSSFGKSVAVSFCGILVGSASEKVIFFSLLGYPTAGANLAITGNAWVSNIITTPNVFATTINAATLKTTTLTTVGIVDVGPGVSASTFEVQGNVFVSNELVTQNLFASIDSTRANVQTMNATTVTVMGTSNISPTPSVNTINVLSISATLPLNFSTPLFRNTSVYQFPTQATSNQFGYTVSLSSAGNVAAIGMNTSTGSVYVYRYKSGSWNLDAIIPSPIVGGGFGFAVSISGDGNTIVVGSANYSTTGYVAGYKYTGGTWVGPQTFPQGPNLVTLPTSSFGRAVSVSGDGIYAVVGAPFYSGNFGWAGFYIYSGGAWVYGFNFNPTGLSGTTVYGEKVCISYDGQTALIAGTRFSTFPGYVRAFKSSDWSIYTELQGSLASWRFGSSLGLSADGTRAIVGANNQQFAGVYTYTAETGWSNYVRLTANGSTFGQSVALSADGNTAIVGASGSSLVSIYYLIGGSWSGPVSLPTQPGTFGFSVSMSSDSKTLLVGAPTGTTVSAAYIYTLTESSNIFASNALSGNSLSVTNTIYYNEDLTKRSLYLTPNATNASAIQSVISATCNAVSKSYWCTSPAPVYGNVLSVSATSNAYSGGVYLPDGRVVFVPSKSTNIGIFNPTTSAFTSVTGVPPGYNGGVLLPNGNVLFVPQTSNIGMFNPVNSSFSNVGIPLLGQSYNGVLSPGGVWLTPSSYSSAIGAGAVFLYDTSTNQVNQQFSIEMLPSMGSATGTRGSGVSVAYAFVLAKYSSINNNGTSYYSSDGKTWTLSTGTTLASLDPSCLWKSVAASPVMFVAIGGAGGYNSAYSTDGNSWTLSPNYASLFSVSPSGYWTSLVYVSGPNYYLAMSPYSSIPLAYSPDGIMWSPCPTQLPNGYGTIYISLTVDSSTGIIYVIGQGGYLCCQQLSGDPRYYGAGWTPVGSFQNIGKNWYSVTARINTVVAVGPDGSAWWSAGGSPYWEVGNPSLSSISPDPWNSVAWSWELKLYVAVGPSIAFSRDGKSWYSTSPTVYETYPNSWNSVVSGFSTNIFVVVGTGDPTTNTAWSYILTDIYNTGSILLPSGNVLFSPIGSSNLIQIDQMGGVISNIMLPSVGGFNGLVLAPDGNVVAVPSGSYVYVINPNLSSIPYSYTNITTVGPIAGSVTNLFKGGTLLPSGNVVFASGTSSNVGMFDPVNFTYSNCTRTGTSGVAFSGATLIPSGQVVFTPYDSANVGILDTFTPVSQELCLSPYFNKF
jgi:hypothetical protein